MRLGLMAFGSNSGLGNQTKAYFDHLDVSTVLGIDISSLDGKTPVHREWYPARTRWTKGLPTRKDLEWLVDNSDVILVAETPLDYYLFKYARYKGVKTVLHYNYEFLDYLQQKDIPFPDVLLSPSTWHLQEVQDQFGSKTRVDFLPFPVDRKRIEFRKINKIQSFVHVAGYKLYEDRNGTDLFLSAIPHIESDVELIIYSQHPIGKVDDPRVIVREMNLTYYWDLYKEGDCLVLPRRYGGQSLQMNEAMAAGMIPIMIDCRPNGMVLHPKSLIAPSSSTKIMTRTMIDCYSAEPEELAKKIDQMAKLSRNHTQELNKYSDKYAESISWDRLKPRYDKLLEGLCI